MATLKAIYDRETGDSPVVIRTHEELSSLVDKVSAYSSDHPCASIVEISVADDPYGFPNLYAGIGPTSGFVQEYWDPPRATIGNRDASGVVVFDLQGNGTEIPAFQEVPLATVRAVLAAYLEHGGSIPADFAGLHLVDVD